MRLICYEFVKFQPESLRKNSFIYLPSCILPSFSETASRLLLLKRLWKCASKLSFRNYKQKVVLLVTYIPPHLRFIKAKFAHVECGIWPCIDYRFCQIICNLLQHKGYKIILFFSACVFWYVVLFNEKLIVINPGDDTFLFYFEIGIKLTLSAIILTIGKW